MIYSLPSERLDVAALCAAPLIFYWERSKKYKGVKKANKKAPHGALFI